MTRLQIYTAVSTALAGGVVVSAFHQRANFYSACVYLSQSNLCLMILINLILLIYCFIMYGLQRLCYGPLRPIEIEQLYEKGWFAVTETCLAMTIFREEVGAWFLVMFVALLTGKVWGWIGDGRVEILEQQPPANPRLFHIRLSISLAMSVIYDIWLLGYSINTVIQLARPNMMVMFLFEFAVLTTTSFATACRYGISIIEARVVKQQTQERLIERRREVREERAEAIRQREAAAAAAAEGDGEETTSAQNDEPLPSEDDVEEMDIEVPGWEAKGLWVLSLDLMTDLVKLLIYVAFFFILLFFYGMPIHIMRDLFMTARSFIKQLTAFLKYRRATRDMNSKYEDATVEDLQREDTCIICREEMRPWSVTNPPPPAVGEAAQPPQPTGTVNERSRPKKLPCGHILHLGCLKSWLERQQACPICRRSVEPPAGANRPGEANNAGPGVDQQNGAGRPPPVPRPRGNMRMLNIGPLRLGFGQGNLQDLANGNGIGAPQAAQGNPAPAGPGARVYGLEMGFPQRQHPQLPGQTQASSGSLQDQLQQIEQNIILEIRNLQATQQELQLVQLLQGELARLRQRQNDAQAGTPPIQQPPLAGQTAALPQTTLPQWRRLGLRPGMTSIPAGSAELPPGVVIPEGWSLLPMQRLDTVGHGNVGPEVAQAQAQAQAQTGSSDSISHRQLHAQAQARGADAVHADWNSRVSPTPATTSTQPQRSISPTIGGSNNNITTTAHVHAQPNYPENQNHDTHSLPSTLLSDSNTDTAAHGDTAPAPLSNIPGFQSTLANPSSTINTTPLADTSADAQDIPGLESHTRIPSSDSDPETTSSLPNWGSSQLFTGPGSNSTPAHRSATTRREDFGESSPNIFPASSYVTPPPRSDSTSTPETPKKEKRGRAPVPVPVPAPAAEDTASGEEEGEEEMSPASENGNGELNEKSNEKGKGKAKPASVEDVKDEES